MQISDAIRTGIVIFTGAVGAVQGIDGEVHKTPPQSGNYSIMLRVSELTTAIVDYNAMRVIKMIPPILPRTVISSGRGGEALILATVKADGTVRSAKVARADSDAMGKSALSAVKQWRFEPLDRQLQVPIRVMFDPSFDPYKQRQPAKTPARAVPVED